MPWTITRIDHVAVVRMDSNKLNIIDHSFLDEWEKTLDTLDRDYADCSVVFIGNDKSFSAGLDLGILTSMIDPKNVQTVESYIERVDRLGWRLFTFSRPTVAAINSHAIAGGTLIASACDYRIACGASASKAKCGLNEVQNGFYIPYRMQKICSFAFNQRGAYKHFVDGHLLTLEQAASSEYGWVDKIVPPPANASANLYSKENFLSTPLVKAAIERVSMNPKSYKAYAYTKKIQQEELRALVESKPNATRETLQLLQQQIKEELKAAKASKEPRVSGKSAL